MSDEQGGQRDAKGPGGPRTRRPAVRLGIAALVIAVLVIVPGYYALQPGFLMRYADLSAPVETWSASTHADFTCQSCHVPPALTSQAAYSARMLGEFYLSLVSPGRRLDVFVPPTSASCEHCHVELVTTSPKGDLIIPHRAHVDVLRLPCVKCHAFLVHEKSPEGKHTPPMAACLTCHDGTQAKSSCVTCHTAKAAPDSHKAADWLVVHPAQQQTGDCATCHGWTKDWCADCHARRPPSHTTKWRSTHALAVKVSRNCENCHTADFCVRCHGDVPRLNYDPAIKLVQ